MRAIALSSFAIVLCLTAPLPAFAADAEEGAEAAATAQPDTSDAGKKGDRARSRGSRPGNAVPACTDAGLTDSALRACNKYCGRGCQGSDERTCQKLRKRMKKATGSETFPCDG
ncbi:MAG: hypothetical protein ACQGVC_25350 [Myxococcota bacterium]